MTRRALVIGGSIAGLFCALHLQRIGWQVDVFEKAGAELAGRGAGIVTHPALFDALATVGIDPNENLGLFVPGRRIYDRNGAISAQVDWPQVVTSWGRLYQILIDRFGTAHYHQGKVFERAENAAGQLTAHFSDGSSFQGELLIGADGVRSTVRDHLEPGCTPRYAGYVAWRGLVDESLLSDRLLADLFPYFAFSLPQSEQMLGYPVAGEGNEMRQGKRRYNFVWYRPANSHTSLQRLLTDVDGNMNGLSIAPNKVRMQVLDEMRHDAKNLLAPQFAELVAACDQPFIQPIFDLSVDSMVHDSVVLLGDAAFVARPHVGMGATKAAVDAQVLANCLAGYSQMGEGLMEFNRLRHAEGAFIVGRARQLGAFMQARVKTTAEREQAEIFHTPQMVLHQTASAEFLDGFEAPQAPLP